MLRPPLPVPPWLSSRTLYNFTVHKLLHLKAAEQQKVKSEIPPEVRMEVSPLECCCWTLQATNEAASSEQQTAGTHKSYALSNRSAPIVAQNICTTHEAPDVTSFI